MYPFIVFLSFTSAPCLSKYLTALSKPLSAAICNACDPFDLTDRSAPHLSNVGTASVRFFRSVYDVPEPMQVRLLFGYDGPVKMFVDGKAVYTPQNEAEASYCKKLKKSDGAIDFNESADRILNKIRAYYGFPGSYFYYAGKLVKILAAEYADQKGAPGEVLVSEPKKGFVIAAGSGALSVTKIQPEGGKAMAVADYLRGHKIPVGTIL